MHYGIRTIVAAVAELDDQDAVLAQALELARRVDATLHLVHAFELPDLVLDAYARMGYVSGDALSTYTAETQMRMEAWARARGALQGVHCHAVPGPAGQIIREEAERLGAELIVVGATRRGRVGRALLGTTAQRVLRGAPAPVLVLRGAIPADLDRVLMTTDTSPLSAGVQEVGLDVVEALFPRSRAELRSLLVVDAPAGLPPELSPSFLEERCLAEVSGFLAERRKRDRAVRGMVRVGLPADEIAAECEEWDAQLLILGTHARSGVRRLLLGSVAEAAVRSVHCNVLVVPAATDAQLRLPVPVQGTEAEVEVEPPPMP